MCEVIIKIIDTRVPFFFFLLNGIFRKLSIRDIST